MVVCHLVIQMTSCCVWLALVVLLRDGGTSCHHGSQPKGWWMLTPFVSLFGVISIGVKRVGALHPDWLLTSSESWPLVSYQAVGFVCGAGLTC